MSVAEDGVRGEEAEELSDAAPPPSRWAQLVFALAVLALGIVVVVQATRIPGEGLNPREARFMPLALGVAWVSLATILLLQTVARIVRGRDLPGAERMGNKRRLALLLLVLAVYAILLEPLGFVVMTVLLCSGAAAVLGSTSYLRDSVISVLLSLGLYLSFTQLLSIHLPPGILPL